MDYQTPVTITIPYAVAAHLYAATGTALAALEKEYNGNEAVVALLAALAGAPGPEETLAAIREGRDAIKAALDPVRDAIRAEREAAEVED